MTVEERLARLEERLARLEERVVAIEKQIQLIYDVITRHNPNSTTLRLLTYVVVALASALIALAGVRAWLSSP